MSFSAKRVNRQQVEMFRAPGEEALVDRVVEHLSQQGSTAVGLLPPDVLRQRIQIALARGRSYGFTLPSSLLGFVTLMFEIAPNFDQHPAFQQVLGLDDPDEDFRVLALYAGVTENEWSEAQLLYDHSAWFRPTLEVSVDAAVSRGGMH